MLKVLKFGGTSVGSAKNMRMVADIVVAEKSRVTVLSAMSGTTDALVKISKAALEANMGIVEEQLAMLSEKYSTCIEELLTSKNDAIEKMNNSWNIIRSEAKNFTEYSSERVIISQGELLTSAIFTMYMQQSGLNAVLLNAPDFMHTMEDGKVNKEILDQKLASVAKASDTYFVTQGFICTSYKGEIDNLGRGGSDYSAALIGAAIGGEEVQIWTDIDGMHNNDPRFVDKTYPIRRMNFDEAAELAYFGAKILHPATIQPCKDMNIPVLLKNTMDPTAPGTRICNEGEMDEDFRAVAAKDGIIVIRIYSTRMLMAYGFLRKVFEVFEEFRTPIDMITTSEVAVSLTIDNDWNLDKIVEQLHSFGTIEIDRDNTIVCVVGRLDHDQKGMAAKVLDSITNVPLKMISYGASHRSLAVLIDTKNKREILQSLNDKIF